MLAVALALCAGASCSLAQVVVETIAPKTAVFHSSAAAKTNALPSFSMIVPREGKAGDGGVTLRPVFASEGGKQVVTVRVDAGTSLYGTGEVAGPLLRNGQTTTLWNHDAYGYDDKTPHLYQSHPWVLGVRADGTSFGIIFDSTYRQVISMPSTGGGEIKTVVDGREFPVVVIERSTPQEVVTALADLTGKMPMPPKWSIGYHQCRYSYYPDTQVMEIAKGFRDRKIPCDVIWHDIDYMHKFLCFTFDTVHFPDPTRHNRDLHALGFKTVWMIDPGIGINPESFPDEKYHVVEQGDKGDHWVHDKTGKPYIGEVWPGKCHFPDYTRKATREWWAGLYKDWIATGVDGVWNDMNEPAVFNVPSKTMPEDNLHRADAEFGGPGDHARFHNVYGMLMIKATREGIAAARPAQRPFVLSRANFLGGHRYGATWTGDNTADWRHLEWSVSMILNIGLSGQPNIGPDIGGFAGNGPDGEPPMDRGTHFARWMGVGAMLPFARGHTGKDNVQKEPWSFGEKVEATCRRAIERRYRLMPLFYTLFEEASRTGLPVARPAFFADPADAALRSEDDVFLLGDGLLVVTQMTPDRTRVPVMPKGTWRKVAFEGEEPDSDLPTLYVRGGSIVPTGPVMQFVDEKPLTEVTLLVSLDEKGEATGTMYEDAGEGYGYQKGEFRRSTFKATFADGNLKVDVTGEGDWKTPEGRTYKVTLLK
jgi:alpha-glucosidase